MVKQIVELIGYLESCPKKIKLEEGEVSELIDALKIKMLLIDSKLEINERFETDIY